MKKSIRILTNLPIGFVFITVCSSGDENPLYTIQSEFYVKNQLNETRINYEFNGYTQINL